jgi:DNA (cytosine-5)-methyltransferase 1
MRILDLYCKAGGASMGFRRAGCTDITGVDIEPQPHYPFAFIQGDAIEYLLAHGHEYDFIHTSPPCEWASQFTPKSHRPNHINLIPATREALRVIGKPYIIENVEGARYELKNPLMLCGSMVGLRIFRHRYFEISPNTDLLLTPPCCHNFKPVLITDHGGPNANGPGKPRQRASIEVKREAMEVDWMTENEITKAVPPRFITYLFQQMAVQNGWKDAA